MHYSFLGQLGLGDPWYGEDNEGTPADNSDEVNIEAWLEQNIPDTTLVIQVIACCVRLKDGILPVTWTAAAIRGLRGKNAIGYRDDQSGR